MVPLDSGAYRKVKDYMLTRYACYLIAQNGDPKKENNVEEKDLQCEKNHAIIFVRRGYEKISVNKILL